MLKLDETLRNRLESSLQENIAKAAIERGWDYYRNDRVMSIKLIDGDTLFAGVRGASEIYMVGLDAGQFRYSKCTCPVGGPCKHMAAVFFAYMRLAFSPEEAEAAFGRLAGKGQRGHQATAAAEPAEPAADNGQHRRPEGTDPGEWLGWMEAEHGGVWRKCHHSLHPLQPVLQSLKGSARDWEKPLQRLHWMQSIVFVLNQAEKAILSVDSFSRYYHEMSFMRMAEPWIEHYYTLALELEPAEMKSDELEWAFSLKEYAKERAALAERTLFDWAYMYMAVCERMSELPEWRERELTAMKAEAGRLPETGKNATFIHTAIAMMFYFVKEDEEALGHLEQAEFEHVQSIVYPCASQRLEEENWEAFSRWMAFLYGHVRSYRNSRLISSFVTLCRGADLKQPENARWSQYMTELLPYSYSELSEHWFQGQHYGDWADLQLLLGVRPDDIDTQDIKQVAKTDPACLIPLYHQSVEEWIAARNRQGYRMAVKQLKKLERLYKSIKRNAVWDRYIDDLIQKYGRLRALQEELRKGKFIS